MRGVLSLRLRAELGGADERRSGASEPVARTNRTRSAVWSLPSPHSPCAQHHRTTALPRLISAITKRRHAQCPA